MSDEPRRAAPATKSPAAHIVPLALMVATAGVAAYVLIRRKQAPAAQVPAEAPQPATPFDDMPAEEPPAPRGGEGATVDGKTYPPAPAGLLEDARWKQALALAVEGDALLAEAAAARAAEDMTRYNAKGNAAEEKFDAAVTLTADWEEELMASYSDEDPQVAQIVETRSGWIKKMAALSKTTSR